jgi:hypothetical protein
MSGLRLASIVMSRHTRSIGSTLGDRVAQKRRSISEWQGQIARVELPPLPKPRSWSASYYGASRRGQPRFKTMISWSDQTRGAAADTLYNIAITLFSVTALLFAIDWTRTAPTLVVLGDFLGSIGCFLMARAGKASLR